MIETSLFIKLNGEWVRVGPCMVETGNGQHGVFTCPEGASGEATDWTRIGTLPRRGEKAA